MVTVETLDYRQWLNLVNMDLEYTLGLGLDNLDDIPIREWYEQGVSPGDAVDRILESQDDDEDFL